MRKLKLTLTLTLIFVFVFSAISCNSQNENNLTGEEVIQSFKNNDIPIKNVTEYTAETDPNDLLGRPNQYIGKINWKDTRIEQSQDDLKGGTLEVFDSQEDLKKRKEYLEPFLDNPMFAQYMYVHKNIIVRIDKELTPTEAKLYKKALESI